MKRVFLTTTAFLLALTMTACGQAGNAAQAQPVPPNAPDRESASVIPVQPETTTGPSEKELDLLQQLSDTVDYDQDTGTVSFTIPRDMPEAVCDRLLIGVVGKLNHTENWSQTWPYFSQANLDGWVAGQTYAGPVQLQSTDFIVVTMALFDDTPDTQGECIAKITATIDRDGSLTAGDLQVV